MTHATFAEAAARLAGLSGITFGWCPDTFWRATPDELAALVQALSGDAPAAPPEPALIARLMERYPDG